MMQKELPLITIVTTSSYLKEEAHILNELFAEGVGCIWMRKELVDADYLSNLIQNIDASYYSRLLLSYDLWRHLEDKKGWYGIHFSQNNRRLMCAFEGCDGDRLALSTSIHQQSDYEALDVSFNQSFISPVFDSISKIGYAANNDIWKIVAHKSHIKQIALGGINSDNINQVMEAGFDGAAVLGAIWNVENPITAWKKIQRRITLGR